MHRSHALPESLQQLAQDSGLSNTVQSLVGSLSALQPAGGVTGEAHWGTTQLTQAAPHLSTFTQSAQSAVQTASEVVHSLANNVGSLQLPHVSLPAVGAGNAPTAVGDAANAAASAFSTAAASVASSVQLPELLNADLVSLPAPGGSAASPHWGTQAALVRTSIWDAHGCMTPTFAHTSVCISLFHCFQHQAAYKLRHRFMPAMLVLETEHGGADAGWRVGGWNSCQWR